MFDNLALYAAVSAASIVCPGPGIVLTLTNTARHGLRCASWGYYGIALGMFLIGVVCSMGVMMLAGQVSGALTALKLSGSIYLCFMAYKLLNARSGVFVGSGWGFEPASRIALFTGGLLTTALNPKPFLFFLSIFPQFVDVSASLYLQLPVMAFVFAVLVVLIHTGYGLAMATMRSRITSPRFSLVLNGAAAFAYLCFAGSMLLTI